MVLANGGQVRGERIGVTGGVFTQIISEYGKSIDAWFLT
jgi:hypothetical protein